MAAMLRRSRGEIQVYIRDKHGNGITHLREIDVEANTTNAGNKYNKI